MLTVASALDRWAALTAQPAVKRLATAFAQAGFELSLVGGPVRDAFLDRPVTDLDFTTNATPDQILETILPQVDAHWDIGRAFGTIGARMGNETVEITTYRTDAYDGATRKPEVKFGQSLEEDLIRRDFTVNAIALRLHPDRAQPELVDPSNGIDDLLNALLRTPTTPEISFGDDPLRMMRAARFSAQLGFTLDVPTLGAMSSLAESITRISAERVREELVKLLSTDKPVPGIRLLVESGIAEYVLPELPALILERDEHLRHKDVYEHSLTVLDQAIAYEKSRGVLESPDIVSRLAALLHDIGKPATRRFEPGGTVSFYHHDAVGAKLARKRLTALRFDKSTIESVAHLINLHLRFFGYSENAWTDSAVRRYVRDAGSELERLHILARSDVTTRNRRKADRLSFAYDDLEERIAILAEEEELAAVRPELDGAEIMALLGIKPGRNVGAAYSYLLELRLEEGILGKEIVTERLLAWWKQQQNSS